MIYIYDPFPGNTDTSVANDVTFYVSNHGATPLVSNIDHKSRRVQGNRWASGYKPLSVVGNDDTLLINAHGHATRQIIGAKFGQKDRTLMPYDLARHIQKDGLSKTHVEIKMITCYGAGNAVEVNQPKAGGYYPNNQLSPIPHFSRVLALELGLLGYDRIQVTGYQGSLSHTGQLMTYTRSDADPATTALRYDARGALVA